MTKQERSTPAAYGLSTNELAAAMRVTAKSILKRHYQTGSYWGVRPIKLPNGRLMWPVDTVERFMGGQ